jgi:hypothetical protein
VKPIDDVFTVGLQVTGGQEGRLPFLILLPPSHRCALLPNESSHSKDQTCCDDKRRLEHSGDADRHSGQHRKLIGFPPE